MCRILNAAYELSVIVASASSCSCDFAKHHWHAAVQACCASSLLPPSSPPYTFFYTLHSQVCCRWALIALLISVESPPLQRPTAEPTVLASYYSAIMQLCVRSICKWRCVAPADGARCRLCNVTRIPEAGLRVAQVVCPNHHNRQFRIGSQRQLPIHDAPEQVGRCVTCSPEWHSVCQHITHTNAYTRVCHACTPFPASPHTYWEAFWHKGTPTCYVIYEVTTIGYARHVSAHALHAFHTGQSLTANSQNLRCVVHPECLVEDAHGGAPRCVGRWGAHSPLIGWPVIPPPHCD